MKHNLLNRNKTKPKPKPPQDFKWLKMEEDEAMGMLSHFDEVYSMYKINQHHHREKSIEDSDSDSSDHGIDKDIMDLLNKQLENPNKQKFKSKLKKTKKKNAYLKAQQNFKAKKTNCRRLNEMSIFINKDLQWKNHSNEGFTVDKSKLQDSFATLLRKNDGQDF